MYLLISVYGIEMPVIKPVILKGLDSMSFPFAIKTRRADAVNTIWYIKGEAVWITCMMHYVCF